VLGTYGYIIVVTYPIYTHNSPITHTIVNNHTHTLMTSKSITQPSDNPKALVLPLLNIIETFKSQTVIGIPSESSLKPN